jgi:hypothetical protein
MCPSQAFSEFRTFDELLDDPLTRLVMLADGVDPEQIRAMFGALIVRVSHDQPSPESVPNGTAPRRTTRSSVSLLISRQARLAPGRSPRAVPR